MIWNAAQNRVADILAAPVLHMVADRIAAARIADQRNARRTGASFQFLDGLSELTALVLCRGTVGLRHRVIGIDNALPWRLPAELAHFKRVTMGHPIIMGRKTYESIGKPLPGRMNIVVSRNRGFVAPGCTVVDSLEKAYAAGGSADEVSIIGGTSLLAQRYSAGPDTARRSWRRK